MALGERALAALHAVLRARATAAPVAEHAAKVLQRRARQLVVAAAVEFEPAGALFELHLAARHHAPVARRGSSRRKSRGLPRLPGAGRRRTERKTFHYDSTRHENSFLPDPAERSKRRARSVAQRLGLLRSRTTEQGRASEPFSEPGRKMRKTLPD